MGDSSCPACEGQATLARFELPGVLELALLRCNQCSGVLAGHEAVAIAQQRCAPSHPLMRARPSAHRCRRCQLAQRGGATRCAHCQASLLLACPRCSREMQVLAVCDVVVDVCRPCELTFFDRGEFSHVCNQPRAFAKALRAGQRGDTAASIALDIATTTIETVHVITYGAEAVGEVALHATELTLRVADGASLHSLAEASGEAALGAAEATAEGASAVGEAVLEVIGGIF